MKLDEYQQAAISTAIYPGKLYYPTLGLAGEAGELTEACVKYDQDNIKKELADCLWYVANLASDCELTLSQVCGRKITFTKNKSQVFWDLTEACECLSIRVGEVAESIKKTLRDDNGVLQKEKKQKIKEALRRIVAVLSYVAEDVESNLEECAIANIEKLKSRQQRGVLKGSGDNR